MHRAEGSCGSLKAFVLLSILLGATGCGPGVVQVGNGPCAGVLPPPSARDSGIDANLIVRDVISGRVEFDAKVVTLLNDPTLQQWMISEINCQTARIFETAEQKAWFVTMREVSNSSPSKLVPWLRETPFPSSVGNSSDTRSPDEDCSGSEFQIRAVNGEHRIRESACPYQVGRIGTTGTLYVEGRTRVKIYSCSGSIVAVKNHRIDVRNSGVTCRWK